MIKYVIALGISILFIGGIIAYYVIAFGIYKKINRKKSLSWKNKPLPNTKLTADYLNKLDNIIADTEVAERKEPEAIRKTCDNGYDCEHCDWVECPVESEE